MISYNEALKLVSEREELRKNEIGELDPTEINLLRQYLLHDIRLLNVRVSKGGQHLSSSDYHEKASTQELIEEHKFIRDGYENCIDEELGFLTDEFAVTENIFYIVINFYLISAYERYGINEEVALEIVSKMLNIPKKVLKELKIEQRLDIREQVFECGGIAKWVKKKTLDFKL